MQYYSLDLGISNIKQKWMLRFSNKVLSWDRDADAEICKWSLSSLLLHLHFKYLMKHPQDPQWNKLFTAQILVNGLLIWATKPKNIESEKVVVLPNTRTSVLKSQQFHEQIGNLGFELVLKDYLLAVNILEYIGPRERSQES